MPSPSIGGVPFFTLAWKKGVPFAHSTVFRQPDVPGESHAVGPQYGESSTITAEVFIAAKSGEKAKLKTCAALCGQSHTVREIDNLGVAIDHDDVFVESMRVVKSNPCAGGPDGLDYIIVIEFTVYLPEDW